jgi:hypothetical protein
MAHAHLLQLQHDEVVSSFEVAAAAMLVVAEVVVVAVVVAVVVVVVVAVVAVAHLQYRRIAVLTPSSADLHRHQWVD